MQTLVLTDIATGWTVGHCRLIVLGAWPQMAVNIESHPDRAMAHQGLHPLRAEALLDKQARRGVRSAEMAFLTCYNWPMTTAHWFTQHERGGFPIERAALGSCELSVLHVGGEWQWLVRQAGRDVAEGAARTAGDARREAVAAAAALRTYNVSRSTISRLAGL